MNDMDLGRTIIRAVAGDEQAISSILLQYMPLINRCSIINGILDEDIRQYVMAKVAMAIPQFPLER